VKTQEQLGVDGRRLCFRCRKWFDPTEGSVRDVGAASGASAAFNVIGAFLPFGPRSTSLRFVCRACQARRRRFQWVLYGTFALVIVLVFVLNALGII